MTASLIAAVVALGVGDAAGQVPHPKRDQMMAAAATMQAASRALMSEKRARGLLPPPEADPNDTGMIGYEYTNMTTTPGDLAAKRTATNPDFAAGLVRLLATLDLADGTPVVLVMSGSFVGADIAAIAAVEALGLRPVIVVTPGTSMWGANNPEFNLLDIISVLRARRLIDARVLASVIGGHGAVGGGMDPASIVAVRGSAERDGVKLVETPPLARIVDDLIDRIREGLAGEPAGAVVNVGGSLIGIGTCRESYDLPSGLTKGLSACSAGTAGIAVRLASEGLPVLHVIDIERLATDLGLPYDPVPLPAPGANAAVYRTAVTTPAN